MYGIDLSKRNGVDDETTRVWKYQTIMDNEGLELTKSRRGEFRGKIGKQGKPGKQREKGETS